MKIENQKDKLYNKLCSCGCFSSFNDQKVDFIKEFDHWFLALNWQQNFLGRTLLILKKHKIDEVELTDEEMIEKHKIYCLWKKAIDQAFGSDKINQAQLGNEEHVHRGHLHWHFVPRYRRPISFAGVEFQSDDAESQKVSYATVDKHIIYPVEVRQKIKEELLKWL